MHTACCSSTGGRALICLGKTSPENAEHFVANTIGTQLGSLSADGNRRVMSGADDDQLQAHRASFAVIAIGAVPEIATVRPAVIPPACIHRGSRRHTCCGLPSLWICRHHKQDCTASDAEQARLCGMVGTPEAQGALSCESCTVRAPS